MPRSCASCSIPGVLADVELDLQRLSDGRRARNADELHDVMRRVGDLTVAELDLRTESPSSVLWDVPGTDQGAAHQGWLSELIAEKRAIEIVVAGETRYAAADDAARYRDALGCTMPLGLPAAFTDPVPRPLEDLIGRYARTHGPFTEREVAARLGVPEPRVLGALAALEDDGRIVRGEFRPEGVRREWCDSDVLRQLRRRSLASLRREVEPVDPEALARFLPIWHGIPPQRRGIDAVVEALGLLAGAPIVASTLETDVLASRVSEYRAGLLDELCTSGEVVWVGAGAIGSSDGRVRVAFADQLPLLAPGWEVQDRPDGPLHDALRVVLAERGASFWNQLKAAAPGTADERGPRRAVGSGVGRRGHQRLAGAAAGGDRDGRWQAAARQRRRPGAEPAAAVCGPSASDRRRAPAAGAWSRRCWSRCRRPPRRRTLRRCNSSSATAS